MVKLQVTIVNGLIARLHLIILILTILRKKMEAKDGHELVMKK